MVGSVVGVLWDYPGCLGWLSARASGPDPAPNAVEVVVMPVCRHRLLSRLLRDPSGGRYVCPECAWLLLTTYTVRLDWTAEWSFLPLESPEGKRLVPDDAPPF